MLKITKANDPITVSTIVCVLYSLPALGKTSVSFTADRPLLYDFDHGSYRAKNRKDVVEIETWDDVANQTREDLEPYKTLVVDTAGRCLDVLTAQIIGENPKNARGSGDLTLQGFGILKGRFSSWLKLMKSYGKDIVLVAHMDERMEGDILKERIDVQGGSKTEIYKSADAIAKLYIEGKLRKLDFSPREGSLGKNPAQLDILTVPDYRKDDAFLASVIHQIKASINQLSEAQRVEMQAIEAWKARIAKAYTAADFNALLPDAKLSTEVVKALVFAASKERGLRFDREGGNFYATMTAAAAAEVVALAKPEQAPLPVAVDLSKAATMTVAEVVALAKQEQAAFQPAPEPTAKPLTEALQASVAAEAPKVSPEPQQAPETGVEAKQTIAHKDLPRLTTKIMETQPKRGRGRPPGAKNRVKPEAAPPAEATTYECRLERVIPKTGPQGNEYQKLEFSNPRTGDDRFYAYNFHRSLAAALRSGYEKVVVFSAHEKSEGEQKFVVLDEVEQIAGVKYEKGQPVGQAVETTDAESAIADLYS